MSLKSKLIRMALKKERGNTIGPCGQQTTLSGCYIEEPLINKACLWYNVAYDESTRTVTLPLT